MKMPGQQVGLDAGMDLQDARKAFMAGGGIPDLRYGKPPVIIQPSTYALNAQTLKRKNVESLHFSTRHRAYSIRVIYYSFSFSKLNVFLSHFLTLLLCASPLWCAF